MKSAQSDLTGYKIYLLVALQLLALIFLVYSNVLEGEFQFDDRRNILFNERVTNISEFSELSNWPLFPLKNREAARPLPNFTFALNYAMGGFSPFTFHVTNVLIHFLASLSLFWFVLVVLSSPVFKELNKSSGLFIGASSAFLFALHPVQTQAVSYVVQRMTSMAALFYLLSMAAYLKGRMGAASGDSVSASLRWYLLTLLFFLFAIWSKETAYSLPAALLLLEVGFVRKPDGTASRRVIGFWITAIAAAAGLILFVTGLPADTSSITHLAYFYTQIGVVVEYLRLVFYPAGLHVDYFIPVQTTLLELITIIKLLFLLGVAGIGVWLWNRHRLLAAAIFLFFIFLSIESSFIPIADLLVEHRLYLALAAVAVAAAYSIDQLLRLSGGYRIGITVLLCVVLGLITYNRNFVWQTEIDLWTDNINKEPLQAAAYVRRGVIYDQQNQNDLAMRDYDRALRLDTTLVDGWNNKGMLLMESGEYEEAQAMFQKAIALQGWHSGANINYAIAGFHLQRYREMLPFVNRAIKSAPLNGISRSTVASYYSTRGNIHQYLEQYEDAVADYEKAIGLDPRNPEHYHNLALCHKSAGEDDQALEAFGNAIELGRGEGRSLQARANFYYERGNYEKAVGDYTRLIELSPGNGRFYFARAALYNQLEEYQKAMDDLTTARRMGVAIDNSMFESLRDKIGSAE